MRVALRPVGLLLGLLLGCGDDPQPGAATRFESSACKTKSGGQGLLAAAQQVTPHDGLRCVTWEWQGQDLRLGLSNFEGGCGVQYAGQAYLDGAGTTVTLSLTNPGGAVAACGWCVYDFRVDVKQVAPGADLTLIVERSNTPERSKQPGDRFQLPAQAIARGVVCDYGFGPAMDQLASAIDKIGQRNWSCSGLDNADPPRCQPGLTCTALNPDGHHRLCLAACTDDAGCGDTLFACTNNVCQIRTPPR